MVRVRYPEPVKLVVGMISGEAELFTKVKEGLAKEYGEIDFESVLLSFRYTSYYQKEMGENLKRKFISFKKLIDSERLVSIKLFTNKLEEKFLWPGSSRRKINIDPGYLTLSKLVLATTKDFSHRIYLGSGIYAEVTLRYLKNKGFQPWEWTYPDYRSREYLEIFNQLRSRYQQELKEKSHGEKDH